jgi:hypothetical protein
MTTSTILASIVREFERQGIESAFTIPPKRFDLSELAAAIARDLALKWSTEPPTAPGRYWFRLSPTDEADVVDVTDYGHAFPTGDDNGFEVATIGGQWAGPLKPPEGVLYRQVIESTFTDCYEEDFTLTIIYLEFFEPIEDEL